MAYATARLALVAPFVIAISCAEEATPFVSWPEGDHAAALLIKVTAGRVQSVTGPFVVEGGVPVEMALAVQRIDLGSEDELLFVGVSAEDILALAPTAVLEEMGGAIAELDGESCAGGRVLEQGRRLRVAVPVSMQSVFDLDAARSRFDARTEPVAFLEGLVLEVPTSEELCLDSDPIELVPFGADVDLLPDGTVINGSSTVADSLLNLFEVARVDEDRVVALSARAIYLFERGRSFQDDEAHVFTTSRIRVPGRAGNWYFSDFALFPEREPGRRRILALGTLFSSPDGRAAGVFELELDDTGLRFTRTSTSFSGFDLKQMTVGPNDEFFAGGGQGWVVSAVGPDAPITAFRVPEVSQAFEVSHWAVGDERLHLFGTYDGGFYTGDVFAGPTGIQREGPEFQTTTLSSMTSLLRPEGAEVFAATSRTGLFRRAPGGGWSPFAFAVPSNVGRCAQPPDDCGRRALARKAVPRGLSGAPVRGSLFFGAQTCSAVFELLPDRGCTMAMVLGGGEAESEMGDYPGVDWRDGQLTVVGRRGRVLEGVAPSE